MKKKLTTVKSASAKLNSTVSKGELKAKMYEYFRDVEESGESLVITDRGVPKLVVYPFKQVRTIHEVFSPYKGKMKINGDILESENDEWGELSYEN